MQQQDGTYRVLCSTNVEKMFDYFDVDEEIDGAETGIDRLVEEMREMMPWEITKDIEREGGAWERTLYGGSAPDKKITHDMIRQFG